MTTTSYVMDGAGPEESRRLALLEAWADEGTKRCLDALGIRPGWSCLEVGAGTGSIARWLCGRVGSHGRVLATDLDCRLLEPHDLPNLEVRRHDVVADDVPEAAFDLVHARMVLEHLPRRAEALRKLAASLQPGGWLVVEDQDIAPVAPAGESTAVGTTFMLRLTALVRLLSAAGVDLEFGRRLPAALASERLIDVGAEGRVAFVTGGSPLAEFWRLTWEQLGPKLIRSGLLSEWDVADFAVLLGDPQFVWMGPAIVAAWGRRPAA
jgi:SAM-dependent methyltransferase